MQAARASPEIKMGPETPGVDGYVIRQFEPPTNDVRTVHHVSHPIDGAAGFAEYSGVDIKPVGADHD